MSREDVDVFSRRSVSTTLLISSDLTLLTSVGASLVLTTSYERSVSLPRFES